VRLEQPHPSTSSHAPLLFPLLSDSVCGFHYAVFIFKKKIYIYIIHIATKKLLFLGYTCNTFQESTSPTSTPA
jgi:hypothetical protein